MRAKRRDRNHGEIRDALRAAGVTVCDTGGVGGGFPDLAALHVVTRAVLLLEVKDWMKPPSARKLTPYELEFSKMWPVVIVTTVDEAKKACGVTS